MNCKNKDKTVKIVLSIGDESGIGPEITLKALNSDEIQKNVDFILVGSKNLQKTYKQLRSIGVENLANPNNFNILTSKFLHVVILNQVMVIQVFIT